MKESFSTTETVTTCYELTTDDLEEFVIKYLKLKGDSIDFDWQIGQWVNLAVTVKSTKVS